MPVRERDGVATIDVIAVRLLEERAPVREAALKIRDVAFVKALSDPAREHEMDRQWQKRDTHCAGAERPLFLLLLFLLVFLGVGRAWGTL
jgi:hypothetical protein